MRTTDDASRIWWMDLERHHDEEWADEKLVVGYIVKDHSGIPIGVVRGFDPGTGAAQIQQVYHSSPRQNGKQAALDAQVASYVDRLRVQYR